MCVGKLAARFDVIVSFTPLMKVLGSMCCGSLTIVNCPNLGSINHSKLSDSSLIPIWSDCACYFINAHVIVPKNKRGFRVISSCRPTLISARSHTEKSNFRQPSGVFSPIGPIRCCKLIVWSFAEDWIFFDKLSDVELPRFGQPYDFDSVLQRPANWKVDPAAGPKAVSMFATKSRGQELGRLQTLSHMDINKIKSFYGCWKKSTST